ncbi:VIT family protein [Actinobaculum sp. 352]|uniref:VIT1/CCC1 transporter family protein n=1 Tax=Actinobaculum sp. 352 TaxID=2490946 RepID=UPI000F7F5C8F|nr:VIT family protein [Actinobaculum sp. 352]RTE50878.1 VIT family protein [Actinobaculum sp. 352]
MTALSVRRRRRRGAVPAEQAALPAQEESPSSTVASRLNWLRAGVLGANDGIVSTAGIVVGVSGAALTGSALLASGLAGVIAGALSMAAGEYVSVSTQRDTERSELAKESAELAADPEGELNELAGLIEEQGVDERLAHEMAEQLTRRDALAAHARLELGIDPNSLANPWHAAFASMFSFILGALIPFVAILAAPTRIAVPVTVVAVTCALAITGSVSAHLGGAPKRPAVLRNICGGLLAMGVTYSIGALVAACF